MSTSLISQAGIKARDTSIHINDNVSFRGFVSARGVSHFLGVQFARIPARFRQAQLVSPESLDGIIDATRYGPVAPQPPDGSRSARGHLFAGAPAANLEQSEFDCLRLNIYAPPTEVVSSGDRGKVPVVVWIHGGGLTIENGNADFSGDFLVEHSIKNGKPIVFVSINYRMGAFGFMSSSELIEEAVQHGEAGWANQGLRDQRLALQWVNNYIHLFGGDSAQITIVGESAGAWSVLAHLRSDQALCQRGIMQSAPSWSMLRPEEAQDRFDSMVKRTGLPHTASAPEKLAALRSVPIEDLVDWNGGLTSPIWDPKWFVGHTTPEAPLDCPEPFPSWVKGIVAGTMRDEMAIFGFAKLWRTKESVLSSLHNALSLSDDPSFCDDVLREYGVSDATTDQAAVNAFITLVADACFSRVPFNLASACSGSSTSNSPALYLYRFDQPDEGETSPLKGSAFHALDNAYMARYPAVAAPTAPHSCRATADMFSQMMLRHAYGEAPWDSYLDSLSGADSSLSRQSRARFVFEGDHSRLENVGHAETSRWERFLTSEERVNTFSRLFFKLIDARPQEVQP
ncbi:carboxylesterase [Aspergillus tetrazonus]